MSPPDQRKADAGPEARRPWRQRFDEWLPYVLTLALVVLAVMSVVSVAAFKGLDKANQALDRQLLIGKNGCQRVQLIRDDVNLVAWGVFNALKGVDMPPSEKIGALFAKVNPDTAALLHGLLAGSNGSRTRLLRIKDAQRYLPPTNCATASLDPTYRFPRSVLFSSIAPCYDPDTRPRLLGCPRK